jgi:hypothetical protein
MTVISEQSVHQHIRQTVTEAALTGAILDMQKTADVIAQVHGCERLIRSIAADLADAAVAAGVPMKLAASVRNWRDLRPS